MTTLEAIYLATIAALAATLLVLVYVVRHAMADADKAHRQAAHLDELLASARRALDWWKQTDRQRATQKDELLRTRWREAQKTEPMVVIPKDVR